MVRINHHNKNNDRGESMSHTSILSDTSTIHRWNQLMNNYKLKSYTHDVQHLDTADTHVQNCTFPISKAVRNKHNTTLAM